MNHLIEINDKRYVVRQYPQKLVLFTFPELVPIQKHYISISYSYLNPDTHEVLVIYQNQISILQPALIPLQLVNIQQSFIDWEPIGGILMRNSIVLYGLHAIIFYTRSNIMEKSWQIDIVQEIEDIKSTLGDSTIAMKVKVPNNTLFLWNMADINIKPNQQIILTQEILQWQFIKTDVLAILTPSEFRIYIQNNLHEFNLHHFYLLTPYLNFCWVGSHNPSIDSRLSVNNVILLGKKGEGLVVELFDIQKRTPQSEFREVGKIKLDYKGINMKRILGAWGSFQKLAVLCETKNHHLFGFQLSSSLQIQNRYINEELLGAQITDVYSKNNLILAKDRTRWKYYRFFNNNDFKLIDQVDCQKAFIGNQQIFCFINKQTIFIRQIGVGDKQSFAFKYADVAKVNLIEYQNGDFYFVIGIRFYRLNKELGMTSVGFSVRNQKAVLLEIGRYPATILYKIGEQHLLLHYKIVNQKVIVSTIKSSSNPCVGIRDGGWIQKTSQQIKLGNKDKTVAIFPLHKLYKILEAQNKNFDYTISSIYGGGIALVVKNYVFFLQLVDDQKGCELVLLKKMNNLLYKRFDPQAVPLKLIDPSNLSFWVGNSFFQLGCRINPGNFSDPFSLPDTLLAKQLDLRKIYPPHHPKMLQSLLQSSKIQLILQILHKIYSWFAKQEKTLSELYNNINPQSIVQCMEAQSGEDNISMFSEKRIHEESQFLDKFANELLENIEAIQLKQKNPFLFQSFLEALSYYLKNSKSVDYFSQAVLIGRKTPNLKGKALNSMHIAYLYHSLNKQEAICQFIPQKVSWDWMKSNSIILWYDNKETIRKWVEQIASFEYRNKKQPFDCLFWYLIAGKKSLLITLFKNHRIDSKEHDAIHNFLQRDFNQAKDRTAAIKNAYVLIDKKRYFHALAFFILGNGIDDCIRLCVDRLKDLNLAYLFCIFFKQGSPAYLLGQFLKGDAWTKHLANKIAGKHILSYNCLFQMGIIEDWSYELQLAGFHPSLVDFSIKIKNSIAVKRELQIQNNPPTSQDIFADFYGQQTKVAVQQPKQKVNLQGDPQSLKGESIHFYLKQGLPLLGLVTDGSHSEARQAYQFNKYKLSGQVQGSMEQILFGLEDKVGIVKCFLVQKKIKELIIYLKELIIAFIVVFKNLAFVEVIRTKKQQIGELLNYGYYCEELICVAKKDTSLSQQQTDIILPLIKKLSQLVLMSKIYASILLKYYEDLVELLQTVSNKSINNEEQSQFWKKIKGEYDNFQEGKKQKFIKQMDHFQHAFINIKRKQQEVEYRMDLQLQINQSILVYFRFLIFNYLAKMDFVLKNEIKTTKESMESYLINWSSPSNISSIIAEFKILLRQGTQAKLKLPLLKSIFDKQFIQFYDIVALTHSGHFQESSNPFARVCAQLPKELVGIEIFRNKQDGVRSFIINKHESKGLQCIVMFKKGLKKIEVCQNLVRRERSKDSYSLLTEDNFYNNIGGADPTTFLSQRNSPIIQQALLHIIQTRKTINEWEFPRKHSSFNEKNYLRQIEPPYLDYNELNSILCHTYLPFFLIGGKGYIQLANINTLKNFDRIKCPGMNQIVKLYSSDQRIAGVDLSGSFSTYHFDTKYTNNCVFSLKKAGIIDFCFLKPSVVATLTPTTVQIYDTLLHPNRQLKFKQSSTKQSICIQSIGDNRIVLLKKNEVLTYDIRMQKLESTKDLKGKGKSLLTQNNMIFVGMADSKVKIFSAINDQKSDIIKLGNGDEKDRQRISVDELRAYDDIVLALNNEGTIHYLPPVQ